MANDLPIFEPPNAVGMCRVCGKTLYPHSTPNICGFKENCPMYGEQWQQYQYARSMPMMGYNPATEHNASITLITMTKYSDIIDLSHAYVLIREREREIQKLRTALHTLVERCEYCPPRADGGTWGPMLDMQGAAERKAIGGARAALAVTCL